MLESQASNGETSPTSGIGALEMRAAAAGQPEWDAALYRSLLARFSHRCAGFAQRSAELYVSGDLVRLDRELGQLSRGARKLGALPLADLAGRMSEVLRNESEEAFPTLLTELRRVLEATVRIIERRVWTAADPFELAAARGLSEPTARARKVPAA